MDSDCLNELKNFFKCKNSGTLPLQQYHGITQDPKTKNYIIVVKFAQNRDLNCFLNKANALSWLRKLELIETIFSGLEMMHKRFQAPVAQISNLIFRTEKGEIKFPENIDVRASTTEINEQAIYSSKLLNPIISEALNIRSIKLSFN
ncbi:5493_t:CDS:2, partial [Gigaspora margarita]